jgi:hypothetical protein
VIFVVPRRRRRAARRLPAGAVVRPASAAASGAVLAALVLGTLAGGEPAWGGAPAGTVAGEIDLSGGPSPAGVTAAGGTVTLSRGGRVFARAVLGDGDTFRFAVPAGAYRVRARSGDAQCPDTTATLAAGGRLDLRVMCQVK